MSCGENHTSALSLDGRLFTWGRGKYGQLGHGDFKSLQAPEPVKALFGSHLVQVWGKVGLQPYSTRCPSSLIISNIHSLNAPHWFCQPVPAVISLLDLLRIDANGDLSETAAPSAFT